MVSSKKKLRHRLLKGTAHAAERPWEGKDALCVDPVAVENVETVDKDDLDVFREGIVLLVARLKTTLLRFNCQDVMCLALLLLLSIGTRYWRMAEANFTVWDEVWMGKFVSSYMKREVDVHPPIGKMLLAVGGWLAGYSGDFPFHSDMIFPSDMDYFTIRAFAAVFGVWIAPLAYATLIELDCSKSIALMAGGMVVFDNALTGISRLILMDAMLLYFIAMAVYCQVVFHKVDGKQTHGHTFSFEWWFWLSMTGVALGCACSTKWFAALVTGWVGLYTLYGLWRKYVDADMSWSRFGHHFLARVLCLIAVPLTIYTLGFYVHFSLFQNSASGDARLTSRFQTHIHGNEFDQSPLEIAHQSMITLKNQGHSGGLLHLEVPPHPPTDPSPKNMEKLTHITAYHSRVYLNDWFVFKARASAEQQFAEIEPIRDGDILVLTNRLGNCQLRSQKKKATHTRSDHSVSCLFAEAGDPDVMWRVELVENESLGMSLDSKRLRTIVSTFRLRNMAHDCWLRGPNVILQELPYFQMEVTCDPLRRVESNTLWNVEQHWYDKMPPAGLRALPYSFWHEMWRTNLAMNLLNSALLPTVGDENGKAPPVEAWKWPLGLHGTRMREHWGDDDLKISLIGNPVVWWSVLVACVLFVYHCLSVCRTLWMTKSKHRRAVGVDTTVVFHGCWCLLGYVMHYLPFFYMTRIVYLHHYFPALYFGILLSGITLNGIPPLAPKIKHAIAAGLSMAMISMFLYLAPFTYGFTGHGHSLSSRQWFSTWDIFRQ